MRKQRLQFYPVVCQMITVLLILTGCGQDLSKVVHDKTREAESKLASLKSALDNNEVRNAVILQEYGKILVQDRPELATLINTLRKDGTSNGQPYKRLVEQLNKVKNTNVRISEPNRLLVDVEGVIKAADPLIFNDSLVDPINVMADMSDGKLARVGVLSKDEERSYNNVKDYGSGSQLVGNPAYGQWNRSGGTSFWEWYGMYALFSNLTGGNRVYYDSWNRNRPYSYYQDYGVSRYGSYNERNKNASTYQKSARPGSTSPSNRKTYSGTRKSSSYSRGGGVTKRTTTTRKTSSYSGSLRSSSYSSRGGYRGGK